MKNKDAHDYLLIFIPILCYFVIIHYIYFITKREEEQEELEGNTVTSGQATVQKATTATTATGGNLRLLLWLDTRCCSKAAAER